MWWLLKSEPDAHVVKGVDLAYAFERLSREPLQIGRYNGVRNPQARNYMRDAMSAGDRVLFYHSSCKTPGIAGVAEVVRVYADPDAARPAHPLFDAAHTAAAPRWYAADLRHVRVMAPFLTLAALRACAAGAGADAATIAGMTLLRQPRLSVQPVTAAQWEAIERLEAAQAQHASNGSAEPAAVAAQPAAPRASSSSSSSSSSSRSGGAKRRREADVAPPAGAAEAGTRGAKRRVARAS